MALNDNGAGAPSRSVDDVGVIYGDVGTTDFKARMSVMLEKGEYVVAEHDENGRVLCQIDMLERKTNLTEDSAEQVNNGGLVLIKEKILADVHIIGFRDKMGGLQIPRTPMRAGTFLKKAEDPFIAKIIGLDADDKKSAYIGKLRGHDVRVALDINKLVQKHVAILSMTGGGKSYTMGVLAEELLKHDVTVVVIDPHGEYGTLGEEGKIPHDKEHFGVTPRGYAGNIQMFAVDNKKYPHAKPLRFSLANLTARDLLQVAGITNMKTYLPALKVKLDYLQNVKPNYSLKDLIQLLESEEDKMLSSLVSSLEYLEMANIFTDTGTSIMDIAVKGKMTIINLNGSAKDIQSLIVNRLATALFELRKVDQIPPLLFITDEAHNYCPQKGKSDASSIYSTIASEGRKFGLGMAIISQRPAKIDKNVLSQCNTQIILKVTGSNDLKAITESIEGITRGMEQDIQSLPVGTAIVSGGGLPFPIFVEIRPRETKHGGESVKVV